jgi:FKBP-type peptidyl-prolyl cis-trans isomerase 2
MIKKGSKVTFHFRLTVDGGVRQTSYGDEPLQVKAGAGEVVDGMEQALMGMKKGEKKTVTVPPEKGYGSRDEKATAKFSKRALAGDFSVGDDVAVPFEGEEREGWVSKIEDEDITIDFNHQLAGKTLQFDIEIVDVK